MYQWIDDIIVGIKEKFSMSDVYEMYDTLNITIYKIDSNSILLKNNDSFYYRDFNGAEVVFIRNDLSDIMEKFILWHEMCHALAHTDLYEAGFNTKFYNKGKIEKQANYFAFKMMNLKLDPIELEGMTLEQISSTIGISYNLLYQLIQ